MPGSPRIERAASLRIQHPNLSTEDAMKLAGYTDEEARDSKRQSNVRQKAHRIATRGTKRRTPLDVKNSGSSSKRIALDHGINDHDYQPLPITFGPGILDWGTPKRSIENTAINKEDDSPALAFPPPSQVGQKNLSEVNLRSQSTPLANIGVEFQVSPRADKAARFWLDNPNLSIEHSMRLAKYDQEEISNPKIQNDIRQTAYQISVQIAAKTEKNNPVEIRSRLTIIEKKIDTLTLLVETKLQDLETRIEKHFQVLNDQLKVIVASRTKFSPKEPIYDISTHSASYTMPSQESHHYDQTRRNSLDYSTYDPRYYYNHRRISSNDQTIAHQYPHGHSTMDALLSSSISQPRRDPFERKPSRDFENETQNVDI